MRLHHLALLLISGSCLAQSYSTQDSQTKEGLRGVSLLDSGVAWASGTHGTYLRSLDGGAHWISTQMPGAETLDFRDVEAFSAAVAYLLAAGPGENSRIFKTFDGGQHWTSEFKNSNPKGFFDCISFWDESHGIAVGDPIAAPDGQLKFELIATDDGEHWHPLDNARLPVAIAGEGAFAASGTCIATQGKNEVWFATGGSAARVFHSSDHGKSWTVSETPITHGPESAGIFSVAFRDQKHGVIAGGDYKQPAGGAANLAFTADGGKTWTLATTSPQSYFSGVVWTESGRGFLAVGTAHASFIRKTPSPAWTKSWDINLNAVSVNKNGDGIGVGPNGTIVGLHDMK